MVQGQPNLEGQPYAQGCPPFFTSLLSNKGIPRYIKTDFADSIVIYHVC